jgi:hypothetical protein
MYCEFVTDNLPCRDQICSSQWTAEEQTTLNNLASAVVPNVKIVNIPPGLDAREGSDGIIKFLYKAVRSSGIARCA